MKAKAVFHANPIGNFFMTEDRFFIAFATAYVWHCRLQLLILRRMTNDEDWRDSVKLFLSSCNFSLIFCKKKYSNETMMQWRMTFSAKIWYCTDKILSYVNLHMIFFWVFHTNKMLSVKGNWIYILILVTIP